MTYARLMLHQELKFMCTLPYQKFGHDSTKRLDLEMVLARSKKVNLVCTRHIFQCKLIYLTLWFAVYVETFVAFSYEKSKEKGNY